MIIFIFPKEFEYENFKKNICATQDDKFLLPKTYLHYIGNNEKFLCKVILDSDIMFTIKLRDFIDEVKSEKMFKDLKFILFGSSGKYSGEDLVSNNHEYIGDILEISKAIKIDRGDILNFDHTSKQYSITLRDEKFLTAEPSSLLSGFKEKTIISTNYLYRTPAIEDKYKDCLFDMETLDFFKCCESSKIENFHCLRFISDFFVKDWYKKNV